jgi:hypothetical protein
MNKIKSEKKHLLLFADVFKLLCTSRCPSCSFTTRNAIGFKHVPTKIIILYRKASQTVADLYIMHIFLCDGLFEKMYVNFRRVIHKRNRLNVIIS